MLAIQVVRNGQRFIISTERCSYLEVVVRTKEIHRAISALENMLVRIWQSYEWETLHNERIQWKSVALHIHHERDILVDVF